MGRRRRNNGGATELVAYLRVSTTEQADSGLGLDAQRRSVEQYAALYKLAVSELIVDDGYSAKDLDRPGMRRVIELLDRGQVAGVIVAKLDRLTRSVRDVGHLVERYFAEGRGRLVSVGEQVDTSTASGRLVLNVLASVGQWEREAIGERTKAALKSKRERGQRAGAVPYGFELDPSDPGRQLLRECKRERAALAEAVQLRARGMTTTAIADVLTERHPQAARGQRFYQPFVWKLLRDRAA
jgi:site-specific DNA recombinase